MKMVCACTHVFFGGGGRDVEDLPHAEKFCILDPLIFQGACLGHY